MTSDTVQSKVYYPASDAADVYGGPNAKARQDEEVFIDIRSIFLMLWRRKYVIFGILLIGLSLTIMMLSVIQSQYTARSLVLVESSQQNNIPSELKLWVDNYVRFDSTLVMNEIEVLRSRSMARMVIERLELLTDPDFNSRYRESLQQYAPELLKRKQTYKSFNIFKTELDSLPADVVEYQINEVITRFINKLSILSIFIWMTFSLVFK